MRRLLFLATSTAVALAAGCTPPADAAAPAATKPIPVRLAPVEPGPAAHPIRTSGIVATKDAWSLGFKVGGVVARMAVSAGERVRRGQVLARLDATELAAGVREARAGVAKARRDADRYAALAASDAAPRTAAEDTRTARAIAEAQLAAAEFDLRHAALVAPDDGWVDQRLAEPGEVVAPGRPVVRISGVSRGFVVRVALPDRDVIGLGPDARATVVLDAAPGRQLAGRVSEIARTAERATGTYQVEIAVDAPRDVTLLSGLPAKVEIARTVDAEGSVPLASVVDGDGESGAVFTVSEGFAARVPVRIAFVEGDRAVLSRGLAGASKVVTDGAPRLSDGARVDVLE